MKVYQVQVRSRNAKGRMVIRSTFSYGSLATADKQARELRADKQYDNHQIRLGHLGDNAEFIEMERL